MRFNKIVQFMAITCFSFSSSAFATPVEDVPTDAIHHETALSRRVLPNGRVMTGNVQIVISSARAPTCITPDPGLTTEIIQAAVAGMIAKLGGRMYTGSRENIPATMQRLNGGRIFNVALQFNPGATTVRNWAGVMSLAGGDNMFGAAASHLLQMKCIGTTQTTYWVQNMTPGLRGAQVNEVVASIVAWIS
jgi:hypothetical protein